MSQNPALDDALRQGWDAYGRGDLAAAQRYAAQAYRLAPNEPQVGMLLQRLTGPPSSPGGIGRMKVALAFLVFEAALIGIVFDMVGRLRAGGMSATVYADGGGSALAFALGSGATALVLPPVAWLLVRAMR